MGNQSLDQGSSAPGEGIEPRAVGGRASIETTVHGLHYDLVDVERLPRGLLRVTIDRRIGQVYPTGESEFVTVEDCEVVTRQLQYVLEVDGVDYARLEVSSPGLDRPLRTPEDFVRFTGSEVTLTLKMPLAGRKQFRGVLGGEPGRWSLVFKDGKTEQQLDFALHELREARLVPVVDFKGRRGSRNADAGATPAAADQGGKVR